MFNILDYYASELDIVGFLDEGKAEIFMERLLRQAIVFYDENKLSPIVKSGGLNICSVDYYYLLNRLAEFAGDIVAKQTKEDVARVEVENAIRADFGVEANPKSKKLLINLFDFKNILYASSDKRWIYTLQRFRGKYNDRQFFISGVKLDGNFIKQLDKNLQIELDKIANSEQYILESTGPKALLLSSDGNVRASGVLSFV